MNDPLSAVAGVVGITATATQCWKGCWGSFKQRKRRQPLYLAMGLEMALIRSTPSWAPHRELSKTQTFRRSDQNDFHSIKIRALLVSSPTPIQARSNVM